MNQEAYDALPITPWLNKQGQPIMNHPDLPEEYKVEALALDRLSQPKVMTTTNPYPENLHGSPDSGTSRPSYPPKAPLLEASADLHPLPSAEPSHVMRIHTRTAATEASRSRHDFHAHDYSSNTTDEGKNQPLGAPTLISDLPIPSQEAIPTFDIDQPLIDLSEHPSLTSSYSPPQLDLSIPPFFFEEGGVWSDNENLLPPSDLAVPPRPPAPSGAISNQFGSIAASSMPLLSNPSLTDLLSNYPLHPRGKNRDVPSLTPLTTNPPTFLHLPYLRFHAGSTPPEINTSPLPKQRRSSHAHSKGMDLPIQRERPHGRPRCRPGKTMRLVAPYNPRARTRGRRRGRPPRTIATFNLSSMHVSTQTVRV